MEEKNSFTKCAAKIYWIDFMFDFIYSFILWQVRICLAYQGIDRSIIDWSLSILANNKLRQCTRAQLWRYMNIVEILCDDDNFI